MIKARPTAGHRTTKRTEPAQGQQPTRTSPSQNNPSTREQPRARATSTTQSVRLRTPPAIIAKNSPTENKPTVSSQAITSNSPMNSSITDSRRGPMGKVRVLSRPMVSPMVQHLRLAMHQTTLISRPGVGHRQAINRDIKQPTSLDPKFRSIRPTPMQMPDSMASRH